MPPEMFGALGMFGVGESLHGPSFDFIEIMQSNFAPFGCRNFGVRLFMPLPLPGFAYRVFFNVFLRIRTGSADAPDQKTPPKPTQMVSQLIVGSKRQDHPPFGQTPGSYKGDETPRIIEDKKHMKSDEIRSL